LHEVVRLAGHSQGRGHSLRDCTQADLDAWLGRPGASRRTAVAFVAWATKTKHMPALSVPASPSSAPSVYADSGDRWSVARRLVRDDGIDIVDRVAGALVVLYAQPVSRIVGLRLVDVRYDHGQAIVTLAGHDLELPEPFATLVGQLPVLRRGGVVNRVDNAWLFPGSRAGRHIAATNLANRLRAIGIEPARCGERPSPSCPPRWPWLCWPTSWGSAPVRPSSGRRFMAGTGRATPPAVCGRPEAMACESGLDADRRAPGSAPRVQRRPGHPRLQSRNIRTNVSTKVPTMKIAIAAVNMPF
jgi:hypothetical protein